MLAKRASKRRNTPCAIRDQAGTLTISEEETENAWAKVLASLCEDKSGHSKDDGLWRRKDLLKSAIPKADLNADISERELVQALMRLKNWKSAGSDGIPPEFFKAAQLGTPFFRFLHRLLQKEWSSGEVAALWNVAEVVPILKKGDRQDPDNYRGISLITVGQKLLNGIIARRLSAALEEGVL
ncbi:MAG: uncharacterized protein A8A55_3230 [Amphiamblys sp. WSBS2006]|nr:MAG: uncharacterized protein A8A55_3230 [Amphiamblys sp. WSBS2006]